MKNVYYAHFMGIYDTPQELRDIETLENLGLKVLNPNTKEICQEVSEYVSEAQLLERPESEYYTDMFDEIFLSRVRKCEVFAFRPLPDGRIPGGVAMELRAAQESGKIIIELPCGTHARSMGRDDTREYLKDIGQR